MIRRPPRSTQSRSSAASDVYKRQMHARAVLDATGHARKLVEFEQDFTPGYQAAFGILVKVREHPFPVDQMLFMDWRDGHLDSATKARNAKLPTFLCVTVF